MNKTFGYARVSTKEQHLDRQIQALRDAGVEERDIITDKASGASLDRPGYQTLKNSMLREGDTLVIKSLDRLSRNKEHITQELRYFKEHHIQVRVLDLPTTMIELPEGQEWVFQMINNILIEVLSSIAEQERVTIRQRQAEGIAAAKARGADVVIVDTAGRLHNKQNLMNELSKICRVVSRAMKKLGIKRSSFYKLVHIYSK